MVQNNGRTKTVYRLERFKGKISGAILKLMERNDVRLIPRHRKEDHCGDLPKSIFQVDGIVVSLNKCSSK